MFSSTISKYDFYEYEFSVSEGFGFTALGRLPDANSDLVVLIPGLAEDVEYFLPLISGTISQRYTPLIINALIAQDSRPPESVLGERVHDLDNLGTYLSNALDLLPCRSLSIISHSLSEAVVLSALGKKERSLNRYISLAGGITGGNLENSEHFLTAEFADIILPGLVECGFFQDEIPKYIEECIGSFIMNRDGYEKILNSLECPK